jgi:hypothetical protein
MTNNPERLMRQRRAAPHDPEIVKRKSMFDAMNASSAETMAGCRAFELPDSALPDELRVRGYDVTEIGDGERILPTAIVEKFVARADGEFEPLTEGSTRPIASTVTHAGIWWWVNLGAFQSFIIFLPTRGMFSQPLGGLFFVVETLDYFRLAIRPENINHPAKSGIFPHHESGPILGHPPNMPSD